MENILKHWKTHLVFKNKSYKIIFKYTSTQRPIFDFSKKLLLLFTMICIIYSMHTLVYEKQSFYVNTFYYIVMYGIISFVENTNRNNILNCWLYSLPGVCKLYTSVIKL